MFSRKKKAERTAAQAWDYLSSAMAAAAESAKEAGRYTADVASSKASDLSDAASKAGAKLADKASKQSGKLAGSASKRSGKLADKAGKKASKASGRVGSAGNEAWVRANAAANALAGRKPGLPWGLIFGFTLVGAAIGWAAAATAKAALDRQSENEQQELAETAVIVTPS